MSTSNPIDLTDADQLTVQQSLDYNVLLTRLAGILADLADSIQAMIIDLDSSHGTDKIDSSALQSFHIILKDLSRVVLPEFFALYHNKAQPLQQKKILYDNTLTLYRQLQRYTQPSFLKYLGVSGSGSSFNSSSATPSSTTTSSFDTTQTPLSAYDKPIANSYSKSSHFKSSPSKNGLSNDNRTNNSRSNSNKNSSINSYLTGEGDNVKTALHLLAMTQISGASLAQYLTAFEPYANVINDEKTLLNYLQLNNPIAINATLQTWQNERLEAFSKASVSIIKSQPVLLHAHLTHPVAVWIIQDYLYEQYPNVKSKSIRQLFNIHKSKETILQIKDPTQFKKGVLINGFGIALISVFVIFISNSSPLLLDLKFIIMLVYMCIMLVGTVPIIKSINISPSMPFYAQILGSGFLIPFALVNYALISMIVSFSWFWLVIATFGLQLGLVLLNLAFKDNDKIENKSYLKLQSRQNFWRLLAYIDSQPPLSQPDKVKEIEQTSYIQTVYELPKDTPLDLYLHAYHLHLLLSHKALEHLKQLITEANSLYEQMTYLKNASPYLAEPIEELIQDVRENTVRYFDEVASQYVRYAQVDTEQKALFIKEYESKIDKCIVGNINKIKKLNQAVLEKRMAGFAKVGSTEERQFRDNVMALKILLRGLFLQQSDDKQDISRPVVLDHLEHTLAKMQTLYFDSQLSQQQRQELQHQVEQLLSHFNHQAKQSGFLTSNSLLNDQYLSFLNDNTSSASLVSHVASQSGTDDFIEYNKYYIEQLLKHWQ